MIFLDTNVVSETLKPNPNPVVLDWLIRHDAELALSSVVVAELAFGIRKLPDGQRASRLEAGLHAWRQRYAGRIFAFTEDCALTYGSLMAAAARRGRTLSAQDGMIAAIAQIHDSKLATRNTTDFVESGITLVNPWN